MHYLKWLIFFLVLTLISFVVTLSFRIGQTQVEKVTQVPQSTFTPQLLTYQLLPPMRALTGKVTQVIGDAQKEPRDQVEPVKVENELIVVEAEKITTEKKASVLITFPDSLTISLRPETIVTFLSTNPAHFLIRQDQGTASYQTDLTTPTISIRSLHALMMLEQGLAEVTTNPDTNQIILLIREGKGTLGYINLQNQTKTVEIQAGQILTFNDARRTVKISGKIK